MNIFVGFVTNMKYVFVVSVHGQFVALPQRYQDEEGQEGEDEEEEAGHRPRGRLLHDGGEEEGEEDDGDAVVDHQQQHQAGVGLGQEAGEGEDHGDEEGVHQDDQEQSQEVGKPNYGRVHPHHLLRILRDGDYIECSSTQAPSMIMAMTMAMMMAMMGTMMIIAWRS